MWTSLFSIEDIIFGIIPVYLHLCSLGNAEFCNFSDYREVSNDGNLDFSIEFSDRIFVFPRFLIINMIIIH